MKPCLKLCFAVALSIEINSGTKHIHPRVKFISPMAINTSAPEIIAGRFEEKNFLSIIKRKNNMINRERWYIDKKKRARNRLFFYTTYKKLLNSDLDIFRN
jgi:hypothetical protein